MLLLERKLRLKFKICDPLNSNIFGVLIGNTSGDLDKYRTIKAKRHNPCEWLPI